MHKRHKIIRLLLSLSLLSAAMAGNQGDTQTPDRNSLGEQVHFVIVSKTHFDIGYSALARDVEHEYRTTMIDRALATISGCGA